MEAGRKLRRVGAPVGVALLLAIVGGAAACHSSARDDASDDDSALVSAPFDKDAVIDDATFVDSAPAAITAQTIQAFFESTPFADDAGNASRSPLASYEESQMKASEIIAAGAKKYHVNPLLFLAGLEAESGLVSATTPSAVAFATAFRCACPDPTQAGACGDPSAWRGFANQVECFGRTMRHAFDEEAKGNAVNGWKKGAARVTDDRPTGLSVTPKNFATAALYAYTPYVGTTGGGDANIGGVSWYWELINHFGAALSYEAPQLASACTPDAAPCADAQAADASADAAATPPDDASADGATADAGPSTPSDDAGPIYTGPAGGCATDHDCSSAAPRCDANTQRCVECLVNVDCPPNLVCSAVHACTSGPPPRKDTTAPDPTTGASDGGTLSPTVPPPAAGPQAPPSGHDEADTTAPAVPPGEMPQFVKHVPAPQGGGVGCNAAARGDASSAATLGFGLALALVGARRRRK